MSLEELGKHPDNACLYLSANERAALAEEVRRTLLVAGLPVAPLPEQYATILFQGKTYHLPAQ